MKRIFAILLALCLCLGACPPVARAAVTLRPRVNNPTIDLKNGAVLFTEYEGQLCYVQDNKIRTANMEAYLPSVCDNQIFVDKVQLYTGTATITGTLSATAYGGIEVLNGSHKVKLQNASLCTKANSDTRGGFEGSALVVTHAASLTLELEGTNTVQGSAYLNIATNAYPGIDVSNGSSLTITGGGTLNVRAGLPTAAQNRKPTADILMASGSNSLTITGGATVNATIDNYTDPNIGPRFGIEIRGSDSKLTVSGGAKLHIAEKNGITASYKAGIDVEDADIDITCYIYGLGNANLTLKGSNSSYTITDYTSSLTYAKVENSTVKFSPGSGSYSVLERGKTAAVATKQLDPGTFSETVTTDKYIRFAVSNKKYSLGVTGGTGGGSYAPESSVSVKADVPNNQVVKEWQITSGEGSFADPQADPATFTMGWTDAAVKPVLDTRRTLTVSGGTASKTEGAQGHTVQLTAGAAPSGQTFSKWTLTSGAGEIKDPYNPNSSFTFGAGNATVTAEFVQGSTLGDFLVVSDDAGGFSFDDTNNVLTISGSGTYTVGMAVAGKQTGHCIVITGNATVILNGVNISNGSKVPIKVGRTDNNDNITLKLSGENTLKGGSGTSGIGALEVSTNYKNTTTLTITSLAGDGSTEGKLTATTSANSRAGIGVLSNPANININGGTIVAKGSNGYGIYASTGTLKITGGDITAEGQNASSNVALYDPKISGEAAIELDKAGNYVDITQAKRTSKWAHVTFDTGSSSVTALTLEPATTTVVQGEEYSFRAQITAGPHATTDLAWEVSGGDGSSIIDENGLLTVGKNESASTLTVKATNAYSGKTATATVTVEKRPAEITTYPTAVITYGQTLSDVSLTSGEAEVPGTFAWANANYKPASAGTHFVDVTFTPEDNSGPQPVTVLCEVTVNPATPTITWAQNSQSIEYTGSPVTIDPPAVTLVNNETYSGTITYSYAAKGSDVFTEGLPSQVGEYQVKARIDAQGNYTGAESGELALAIVKGTPSIGFGTYPDSAVYSGEPLPNPASSQMSLTGADFDELVFTWKHGETILNAPPTDAGDYTLTASVSETDSHSAASKDLAVTINPLEITVTPDSNLHKEYNAADSELTYTVNPSLIGGDKLSGALTYEGEAIGQYAITQGTLAAPPNYALTVASGVMFEITRPSLENANVTVNGSYTYTGAAIVPATEQVKVVLNGMEISSDQYTISASGNTNVGTATVTITAAANGNYYGIASGTFAIGKATLTADGIGIAKGTYGDKLSELAIEGLTAKLGEKDVDGTWKLTGETIPSAGDSSEHTVTFIPGSGAGNYNELTAKVTLKIDKAEYTGTKTAATSAKFGTTATYDLSPLLPEEVAAGMPVTSGDIFEGTPTVNGKTLSYRLVNDAAKIGSTGTITVPVTSTNYKDFNLTITVTAADKSMPTLIVDPITVTYTGEAISNEAIKGTATVEGKTISGTWRFETAPIKVADSGTKKVTFTPDEDDYAAAEGLVTVTINKATPSGNPSYIAITESGKTLSDANLTAPDSWPAGTLSWEDADTTGITANTAYSWTFTPTDGANYNTLSGSVTLWIQSSGGSGGGSQSSLPVSTTGQNSSTVTTTTTAIPTASVQGGEATASVDTTMGNEIVRQAVANKSENVTISPKVTGNVTKVEVSVPVATVGQIGSQTSASLTISTPVADVTIPNGGLGSLTNAGGNVTVSAEKTGNTVELTVTAGGKTVDSIPGGLTLTVPAENTTPGTVAVLVHEDGTREVVRKSVADGDSVTIPLDGSAKLEIVDNSKPFSDVPADSWMAEAVAFASAHELFNGTGNGQFSPNRPMSRGMLAVVLHNLENNPEQAFSDVFSDVGGGEWYAEGVAWAASNGIVSGYGNGQFGPNNNITREQLAVMLWRYAGSPAAANTELHFNDADAISDYALEAMRWVVENGIMSGFGNGLLGPQGLATRAQVAQMLKNYMNP